MTEYELKWKEKVQEVTVEIKRKEKKIHKMEEDQLYYSSEEHAESRLQEKLDQLREELNASKCNLTRAKEDLQKKAEEDVLKKADQLFEMAVAGKMSL